MLDRIFLCTICLALVGTPAFAKEKSKPAPAAEPVACSGVFGVDSSEALLIETYGEDNVVTGQVDGPEGSSYLASTVFPDDPDRKMEFIWFDEDARTQLSGVELAPSQSGPGGVRIGMTPAEVQAINGQAFTMGGFWWDLGGYAGFETGALAGPLPGECYLSLRFSPDNEYSGALDLTPVTGDVLVSSEDALLAILDTRVTSVSIGYAFEEPAE